MAGFEDLEVWKRSVALSADIYTVMVSCRDFGFEDQITRSCLSVASNMGKDHHNPSCDFIGEVHKHRWN